MQKWEYLFILAVNGYVFTVNGKYEERVRLPILEYVEGAGKQGWELVSVVREAEKEMLYHFKRPIESTTQF